MQTLPKISLVTAVYNGEGWIADCIRSIREQNYPQLEWIVVDGASKDSTVEIVKASGLASRIISEKDRGIYDAMNKGLKCATGQIVGLLNADDEFAARDILWKIARAFEDRKIEAVYADVLYVDPQNTGIATRLYSSKKFSPAQLKYGWVPAHPSLYLRKEIYDRFGYFNADYKIAGDFDFMARIFRTGNLKSIYFPEVWVRMREGGLSNRSLKHRWTVNREIQRSCRENGIKTNLFLLSLRYPMKLLEFTRIKGKTAAFQKG